MEDDIDTLVKNEVGYYWEFDYYCKNIPMVSNNRRTKVHEVFILEGLYVYIKD